jgi:hypothetical protein
MRNASYSDSFRVAKAAYEVLARSRQVMCTRVANFSNIVDAYGYDFVILCADETLQHLLDGTVSTDCFMI